MNDYINVKVQITPYSETVSDILSALLADIGFESFVQTATGLDAYIQTSLFNKEKLESVIERECFREKSIRYGMWYSCFSYFSSKTGC